MMLSMTRWCHLCLALITSLQTIQFHMAQSSQPLSTSGQALLEPMTHEMTRGVVSSGGEFTETNGLASTEASATNLSNERNVSKLVAPEFATSATLLEAAAASHQASLMPATVPTTLKPSTMNAETLSSPQPSAETRLRWVDFRRHQPNAYPPRMPVVPGIPSGFRNPVSVSVAPTSTPPQPTSPMYSAGGPHAFFGSSNSNPVVFGGSVIMDEEPFKVHNPNRRYNITRVEHISAECSDEYMKVVIRFNGTFTGLIYSSGYVHDANCIYVNGSGRSSYEFFIRLNQCGTLGRQEMYHPTLPGEARRRDQLMWNTLSIQYNAMIEEEFDEHFRLTCEYGSDFWKTVTFPSVNVEINTGSPVVFTINPPQCQMEIRRGFGVAGSRTSGPVTVGDPLTLIIHMKSEKDPAYDILVKNCVAHNGAQQRMQLIDSNGCVTNEKLISPFRGTYNSENGHQVSLFSYLKAFRFTGSPALYLECDIHMCHNRCPPQRCYWRNLSKRSVDGNERADSLNSTEKPIMSESISLFQALEVYHEQDKKAAESSKADYESSDLVCLRSGGLTLIMLAFMCLMSISIGTSICYCLRMRRVKHFQRNILHGVRHLGSEYSSAYSVGSSSDSSVFTDKRKVFARLR